MDYLKDTRNPFKGGLISKITKREIYQQKLKLLALETLKFPLKVSNNKQVKEFYTKIKEKAFSR